MIKYLTMFNIPKEIFVSHIVGGGIPYQVTFTNVDDETTIIMGLTNSQAKDLAMQLLNNLNTLEVLEDLRDILNNSPTLNRTASFGTLQETEALSNFQISKG